MDILKIVDLFERNLQQNGEPLVSIQASAILSDTLSLDNSNTLSSTLYQRLTSQPQTLQLLQQLLDINRPKSDLKKIDGTNYGCPYGGYYD